jgi:hypothetical protein
MRGIRSARTFPVRGRGDDRDDQEAAMSEHSPAAAHIVPTGAHVSVRRDESERQLEKDWVDPAPRGAMVS